MTEDELVWHAWSEYCSLLGLESIHPGWTFGVIWPQSDPRWIFCFCCRQRVDGIDGVVPRAEFHFKNCVLQWWSKQS